MTTELVELPCTSCRMNPIGYGHVRDTNTTEAGPLRPSTSSGVGLTTVSVYSGLTL
jgi:hypothetical protein